MARREGELKAKEFGFKSFPIDPFKIAKNENIHISAKPPDRLGVSGGIIFDGDNVGIFYATNIQNKGFQRFTVGHELGHYFLEGHPEEIQKTGNVHFSRAGFSQGNNSIELEADHFSSGLLMPTHLVLNSLNNSIVGLEGILNLSEASQSSLTASAIRTASCCEYPIAIIVSSGKNISYCFLSASFKKLGKLNFLQKDSPLPQSQTLLFNDDTSKVLSGEKTCAETTLSNWFGGSSKIHLDEEIIGLGSYGFSLTVLSSDTLPCEPDEEDEEEENNLMESWTPRFARGR